MPRFAESSSRVSFKTMSLSARERDEAYRALLTGMHIQIDPDTFAADIDVYDLGELLFLRTRVKAQTLRRTPDLIRRDGRESIVVHLSTGSAGRGLAGDRSIRIRRGGFAVSDHTRELVYDMPAGDVFTLIAQRAAIESRVGSVDALHGLVLEPSRAAFLSEHVQWLGARLPNHPVSDAPGLARSILDVFAATVDPSKGVLERTRDSVAAAAFARACRFIDDTLTSPALDPALIAKAAGLSRSALYRQFEPLGGVAAYVRRRRLEAARTALLDPRETRTMAALAYDLGFSSQALFNRLFRDAFGHAPRELRGLTPANDAQDRLSRVDQTNARFNAWLRRLG